jgi:hypothetical protein
LVPARLCRVSKVHTEAVPISLPSEWLGSNLQPHKTCNGSFEITSG